MCRWRNAVALLSTVSAAILFLSLALCGHRSSVISLLLSERFWIIFEINAWHRNTQNMSCNWFTAQHTVRTNKHFLQWLPRWGLLPITLLAGENVLGPMTSHNVYGCWDKPPTSSLCVSMSWWVHSWSISWPADESSFERWVCPAVS